MNQDLMQNVQQVKNMMRQMQMMKNPNMALHEMIQQNPQMSQMLQICQGQNPKEIFYSICKQRGVDPEQIINMLKS